MNVSGLLYLFRMVTATALALEERYPGRFYVHDDEGAEVARIQRLAPEDAGYWVWAYDHLPLVTFKTVEECVSFVQLARA